ncbi:MAG: TonB-dependent receptor [Sulfurimonas sp.]|jgi:iron complex outermembrane receptor protein
MKNAVLLSLAATLALASEPVTIQKITVEASAPKADAQSVSADEMVKFSRQSDLGEMLSNTLPEVTMVRNSGVGNDIILRGFRKDNLNITIDDAKVCGACPNRMDPPSMHVSSNQIKSVEVQEGPFDVTKFGSLGGKINVVTKDPQKGVHGEVSATLGSFDYRKLSTTLEGGNDTVQAQVGFSRETSGQYKDGNGRTLTEQTDFLIGNLPANFSSLTPTQQTNLMKLQGQKFATANKNMSAYDRNNYWTKIVSKIGDNQKLTLSYFGDRADNVLYPRYPMDAQVDDTDMFKAKYQFFNLSSFSDELKIEGYHSKVKHVMGTDFRASAATMVMVAPVDATIQGALVENTMTISGAKVAVGVDTSLRNWDGTKGPKANPAQNIMLPDVDTKNIALYAKGLKTIGKYEISSGVRYDDTTINPNQGLAAIDPLALNKTFLTNMKDRSYNDVSANLLAKYNYTAHTNVFIGAGQSIRVPDAKELYWVASGNTNLNETKNREIDLGAEHTAGNLHVKGTIFYSDLKDFIYAYQTSATTSSWANIDATIVGLDIHGDYLLGNEWRVESGAAYQKGSKKDPSQLGTTQTNNNLAEIPPLKGRAALVFDDSSYYAMAEWIAATHQTIDSDNGEKEIAGYALLNLKYGAELGKGFSLSTGINNFFNRTYALNNSYIGNQLIASSGTAPLVLNEPGRNFYTTLSYKF